MKLTKDTVGRLALPKGKQEVIFWDDSLKGFGLRFRAGGSAMWVAQYRIGVKQRRVTLGKLAALDPEKARKAAREVIGKAGLGKDAQEEKQEERARAAVSFRAVADLYLTRVVAASQRPKTQLERKRHLNRDWQPFHSRPLHKITRRDVAARVQAIAEQHGPVAANRSRATLRAFYVWAMTQGLTEANPTIGTAPAAPEKTRDRVLSAEEIVAVSTHAGEGDFGRIVRLLLLTGQRREEVAALRWSELHLDKALWSLPGTRTKNGLPHDVPLSTQAVELLRSVPRRAGRDLLFGAGDGPFSGWAKSKERVEARMLAARGHAEEEADQIKPAPRWTLHDLRRTVVTGMNELGIQPHVVEAVVNHVSGRARAGVAGIYNRATYATEKRMALQAWADHLDQLLGCGERKVILIHAGA